MERVDDLTGPWLKIEPLCLVSMCMSLQIARSVRLKDSIAGSRTLTKKGLSEEKTNRLKHKSLEMEEERAIFLQPQKFLT